MKKAEAYWPLILLLAIVKFVLPLFLRSPVFELHRDEYLYYQQGQHLAFGFLENPPLLSLMARISSWFGGSEAWVRLWPCLFGAATLVITCLIVSEFGGRLFAQFLAGLAIMTGGFLRVHFLFQPNFLDIFFWTLAVYFLVRYVNSKEIKFMYGVALSLAVGWWGKYSVLFMVVAILLGLLLTRHRAVFLKKQAWIAIALGVLVTLPNVWWQYQHNWPLLHHMDELQSTQLKYVAASAFLKDQLLMLLAVSFVWIVGLIWLLRHREYRIVAYLYLIIISLLLLGKGKSYYSIGAYPMLLAAGAVAIERFSRRRYWVRYGITIVIIGISLVILPIQLPVWRPEKLATAYARHDLAKMGFLKWEDHENHALPQDLADMLGWKELAERTERFYHSLPDSSRTQTFVFCQNYGQAGSLKYYARDPVFADHVISANGSFLLWMPDRLYFKNIIFVASDLSARDSAIFRHFRAATPVDSVRNTYSRQLGDQVISLEIADSVCVQLLQSVLDKRKKQFSR